MLDTTVQKATGDDVRQVGRTLARALRDDPAIGWAYPERARRERLLPGYFELLVRRIYLPLDEVYITDDGMAAALWAPPGKWRVPAMAAAQSRSAHMASLVEARHEQHDEPHYYLPYVGTDPDHQRQGYGTLLLHQVLDRCDEQGIAAYLESTSLENRVLYHRLGFEVVEELHWPDGGPPFWPMWREPR